MKGIIYIQLIESNSINYKENSHVTIQYGDIKPIKTTTKNLAKIIKVGQFTSQDHELSCDIVTVGGIKLRNNGTLFHITTYVAKGRKPVESGLEATKHQDQIQWCEPVVLKGIWKADLYDDLGEFLIEEILPTT